VDVDKLCPPGLTAKTLGSMYTTEFIEKCLVARPEPDEYRSEKDFVKNSSVEVIGQLFYLILSAKTRTRNEIMKSRKKLVASETYGASPKEMLDDADILSGDELDIGQERWQNTIDAALAEARKNGVRNLREVCNNTYKAMTDEWLEEKRRRDNTENVESV